MKTSTHDLLIGIPAPVLPLVSRRILGQDLDRAALAERLADPDHLYAVATGLPRSQQDLLLDLYEAGGQVDMDTLARALAADMDALRSDLESLGRLGLVYQGGLSGRDPLVLLPSLALVIDTLRSEHARDAASLEWRAAERPGLWAHATMVNALAAFRIRCKAGLEPFKRGREQLDAALSHVMDTPRIYNELVELGCLADKDGFVVPLQRAVNAFVLEGDVRYAVWRFIRSCRMWPGLDFRIFVAIAERALRIDYLERVMSLFILTRDRMDATPPPRTRDLVEEWVSAGVLEKDVTGSWVRFSPAVHAALKTGKAEPAVFAYSDEVVVQPTLDILVPRDFDPVDLVNVGEMADLVQADIVSVYRITKGSVFRALQAGWTDEKLINFLQRISRHSLPDTVRVNITGWCRLHAEAVFIRGTFLVFSGERALLPRGLEEVLPGIYRIPRYSEEEITAILAKKGVMVRDSDEDRDASQDVDWGKAIPLSPQKPQPTKRIVLKEGVYPFGMIVPVPFGPRREMFFEEALKQGRELVVFYPRQGYGELQVRRITPISVFRRAGMPFMEAYCEDTREGEVFDLTRVRAVLRD